MAGRSLKRSRYAAAMKQTAVVPKTRLTAEQAKAREEGLRAAGIAVVTGPPAAATITLLKRTPSRERGHALGRVDVS